MSERLVDKVLELLSHQIPHQSHGLQESQTTAFPGAGLSNAPLGDGAEDGKNRLPPRGAELAGS